MDTGETGASTRNMVRLPDIANNKAKEEKAIELILAGIKERDALTKCDLPYKVGDKNYRRVIQRAGLTKSLL